ncbi:MAG: 5-amino-6-(5-phosphoribosylamino)uracil reductase [Pseudonocardiales bacterium]|nr:MAG: 5-amino-6-(5-phosphoribosylamino)uracil reductase [Pseudonocardiales bacterium]
MTRVTCNISVSVDGFAAGPRQSVDNPLGEGGLRLHEWHFTPQGQDQAVIDEWQETPGAYVMGRNMFAPGRGDWDLDWKGWWGDEPPYHAPVFVLTHHPRGPLAMDGGTTFHFVTDGPDSALAQAAAAAGGKGVEIAGGASTVNAYLQAGLIEELHLHVSPVLLGSGERLFDGVPDTLRLEPVQVIGSPGATHIKYRLG